MIGTDIPAFVVGPLVGATLLLFGLSFGLWLGRRTVVPENMDSLREDHLASMLRGLFRWTDGFASDVSEYREAMDRIGKRCKDVNRQPTAERKNAIVPLLSEILQANAQVTNRLEKAEAALQKQAVDIALYVSEASTDPLTGLANRRAFDGELSKHFGEWRKRGRPVSLLILDIDHFKRFNDEHGHPAGDAVLCELARVMRETVPQSDLVVRLGGEEFAIVLPGCQASGAAQAAERVRCAVERSRFQYEGTPLNITVSCGAAQAQRDEEIPSLIKRADEALYASKAAGRNCVHWHDGRGCQPVSKRRDERGEARSNLAAKEEFRQVCDQLKNRLQTVVQHE